MAIISFFSYNANFILPSLPHWEDSLRIGNCVYCSVEFSTLRFSQQFDTVSEHKLRAERAQRWRKWVFFQFLFYTLFESVFHMYILALRSNISDPTVVGELAQHNTTYECVVQSEIKSSRVLPDRWRRSLSAVCRRVNFWADDWIFVIFQLHMISEIGTGGEFSSLFCVCIWFSDFLRLLRVRADMWHILWIWNWFFGSAGVA